MTSPFTYVAPTETQKFAMTGVSQAIEEAYDLLRISAAPSAERTLAIRKLQEARMWANTAILGITL